jgi:hypothetical protein
MTLPCRARLSLSRAPAGANRKSKLAGERQAEKEFSRSEGFVDKNAKKNLAKVQLAVGFLPGWPPWCTIYCR